MVLTLFVSAGFVRAEEEIVATTVVGQGEGGETGEIKVIGEGEQIPTTVRTMNRQKRANVANKKRSYIKENMKDKREIKKEEFKNRIKARKEEMKNRKESFKAELEHKREVKKEELNNKREELKGKLKRIKNKKKEGSVLRISDQIEKINIKATDRLSNFTEKIDSILGKIMEQTDLMESRGLEVAGIRTAISVASSSIDEAKTAIATQAGVVYTIEVADEATLRSTVKIVRDNFHSDIKALHEQVKKSYESIRDAIKVLSGVREASDTNGDTPATDTRSTEAN